MLDIVIRPANNGDIEEIIDLTSLSWMDGMKTDHPQARNDSLYYFRRELEDLTHYHKLYIAELNRDILGSGGLQLLECDSLPQSHPDFERVELKTFFVKPGYKGRGIGKKLFSQLIEDAKSTNKDFLYIQIPPGIQHTMEWYKRNGFVDVTNIAQWYNGRNPVMRLKL